MQVREWIRATDLYGSARMAVAWRRQHDSVTGLRKEKHDLTMVHRQGTLRNEGENGSRFLLCRPAPEEHMYDCLKYTRAGLRPLIGMIASSPRLRTCQVSVGTHARRSVKSRGEGASGPVTRSGRPADAISDRSGRSLVAQANSNGRSMQLWSQTHAHSRRHDKPRVVTVHTSSGGAVMSALCRVTVLNTTLRGLSPRAVVRNAVMEPSSSDRRIA